MTVKVFSNNSFFPSICMVHNVCKQNQDNLSCIVFEL